MSNRLSENTLVKKPNQVQSFTKEQINELISCQDPINGPHYFINNFFYIQHPTKGKIKYKAYDYQVELLDSYHKYRFSINMLGRQLGKTTTAVGYLLWYAMFMDNSTILIAAHKYTGAQEIMQRLRYGYEMCPDHIKAGVVSYNRQSIEFENNSRIIAQTTTETTGRGMSVSLLYCLDGDTSVVKIRNKTTLVEEDITLKELFIRLYQPKKVVD